MIIHDGYAADTTEGGEVIYSQTVFRFSWETEQPERQTPVAKPRKTKKRDGFQLQLF